jgi:hypothetical protein
MGAWGAYRPKTAISGPGREMNIMLAIDHPYILSVKEIVVGSDFNSMFMVPDRARPSPVKEFSSW